MLNTKNIKLYLYKIDAHSNHKWNDRADVLVKMRAKQEEIFTFNLNRISQLSFHYKRNSIIPDIPIKETIKKVNKLKHMVELTNLAQHDISLNNKIRAKIDINLTSKMLGHTKIMYNKTNSNDQLVRKRIIKLFNDEFPTRHIWHQRMPDIYKTELCPFCKEVKENNVHIFACQQQ